ncbi:hypothetical protein CVT24_008605 [Panaeolus cyanescens]|uniref:BTB domain-containing protein n=1 Tax=Panaeolus cyanescens TaxID=181874 RepID=A0A409VCX1_9AGAR|nr:hypothetical protein CVT24_008605 [Panaeolus cyanescens]
MDPIHQADQKDPDVQTLVSTTVHTADPPFHSTARGADAILRSTDNVDFYVSSAFIAFSCPDFHDEMVDLVSRGNKSFPIIEIEASSTAVRFILRFMYPASGSPPPDKVSDIKVASEVVQFSNRYGFQEPIDAIKVQWNDVVQADPYRALVQAHVFGWNDMKIRAITETFRLRPDQIPFFSELSLLNGLDFREIVKRRATCCQALSAWGESSGNGLQDIDLSIKRTGSHLRDDSVPNVSCTTLKISRLAIDINIGRQSDRPQPMRRKATTAIIPTWFQDHQSSVMELLQKFPHPQTLESAEVNALTEEATATIIKTCKTCTSMIVSIQEGIRQWHSHVKDQVAQIVSQHKFEDDE